MKTQTIITLDNTDMADPRRLGDAFNLVGGSRDKVEARQGRSGELSPEAKEAKLFGKIGANQFTFEDAQRAVRVIGRRGSELLSKLNEPVFLDEQLQKTWADGIRANVAHALRLAEGFLDDLRGDLAGLAEEP